jgi:hypothetical protein
MTLEAWDPETSGRHNVGVSSFRTAKPVEQQVRQPQGYRKQHYAEGQRHYNHNPNAVRQCLQESAGRRFDPFREHVVG